VVVHLVHLVRVQELAAQGRGRVEHVGLGDLQGRAAGGGDHVVIGQCHHRGLVSQVAVAQLEQVLRVDQLAPEGREQQGDIVRHGLVVVDAGRPLPAFRLAVGGGTAEGCIVEARRVDAHAAPLGAADDHVAHVQGRVVGPGRGVSARVVDLEPPDLHGDLARRPLELVLVVLQAHVEIRRVAQRVDPVDIDVVQGGADALGGGPVEELIVDVIGSVLGPELAVDPDLVDPADLDDAVDGPLADYADDVQVIVPVPRGAHVAMVEPDAHLSVNERDLRLGRLRVDQVPPRALLHGPARLLGAALRLLGLGNARNHARDRGKERDQDEPFNAHGTSAPRRCASFATG